MSSFRQDVAFGIRGLRHRPGFAFLALAVLGSAVGLATSLFTIFNGLVLRPWSVPDPGQAVRIFSTSPRGRGEGGFSLAEARYLGENAVSFDGLFAEREAGIDAGLMARYVSGGFFDALRVPMAKGRALTARDDTEGGSAAVAVLSHAAWQKQWHGAPDIVGRAVRLHGVEFTVIGVAAPPFAGTQPTRTDVWMPLAALPLVQPGEETRNLLTRPDHCCSSVAGRLKKGVSREQAQAELRQLSQAFHAQFGLDPRDVMLTGTAMLDRPKTRGRGTALFALMFGAVALVLLLACANVGNLLLARGAGRRHEIAIRLSLGASRGRVVRQLLVESLILATAAGALGLGLAWIVPTQVLARLTSEPLALQLTPDLTVLAFIAAAVALVGVGAGLAPALHNTRSGVARSLKERGGPLAHRISLRGGLLATQIAVSVVLLSSGGLLVRAVRHAAAIDPGFAIDNVTVASFSIDTRKYDEDAKQALATRFRGEIGGLSAAHPVALTNIVPLGHSRTSTSVREPGQTEDQSHSALSYAVSATYFELLGIPIRAGRVFAAGDPGVLVNETLARRQWNDAVPLGQTLVVGGHTREVIGVVADTRTASLDVVEPSVYGAIGDGGIPAVLIRNRGAAPVEELTAIAARLDPQATVNVRPLSANLAESIKEARVGATLAGAVGVLGLILATVGLSGVFAYVVEQRTREIGVRMALGARAADILRLVLGSAVTATTIGLLAGLVGAVAASQVLRSHLYGLSPLDPGVYAAVALLLLTAGVGASYVPARRALRVDPTVALRYE